VSPSATPTPPPSPDPDAGSAGSPRSSGSARPSGSTAPSSTPGSSDASSPASATDSADASSSPTVEPAAPAPVGSYSEPPSQPKDGQPVPDPVTTAAVQTALGTEYAAVWCYSLIEAFLPETLDKHAREDLTAHRVRRDATIRLLADSGVRAVPAEAAYRTPAPVTDQNSAMRLVVSAESDAAAAWRSVLERCDDSGLRRMALDGLTDAAVRGARWSEQLGSKPVVPAFPGRD
jgi:Domain of unknown function (DUF4439)